MRSSIHGGNKQSAVAAFVRDHLEALASVPTVFLQVSLSSATDDEERRARAAGAVSGTARSTARNGLDRVAREAQPVGAP